jgi:hypothetical protein
MAELDPKIRAEFIVDDAKAPLVVEKDGKKHFHIRLFVDDAPTDAYAVTYELDPSYYDAVREARDADQAFAEDLTSFGDYTVRANVRTRSGRKLVRDELSRALARSYPHEEAPPAILDALAYIRQH